MGFRVLDQNLSQVLPGPSYSVSLLDSTASHFGKLLSALSSLPGILQSLYIPFHPSEKPFLICKNTADSGPDSFLDLGTFSLNSLQNYTCIFICIFDF